MSWFSELTSKAEAMLVKLDQETAQALQNPPQLLTKSKYTTQQIAENKWTENGTPSDDEGLIAHAEGEVKAESMRTSDTEENQSADNEQPSNGNTVTDAVEHNKIHSDFLKDDTPEQHTPSDQISKPFPITTGSPNQLRRFKMQTSKLRPTLHNEGLKAASTYTNGYKPTSKRENPVINLGADDIRASINRSLQEYTQSSLKVRSEEESFGLTTYSSHFDNQPNLISSTTVDEHQSGRLHSSASFSIDVPDDNDRATNITSQILRQSTLTKKSPFNLHKVINKLASHRGQSQSLLGDKTKIRVKRAQMRAASYLRRMNYYFQAYPTMKYWMIGYLVVLQILVVYVLFFYQFSGSSSYLSNQVKQQQQELAEPLQNSNSEKIHPYSSDQDFNRFR